MSFKDVLNQPLPSKVHDKSNGFCISVTEDILFTEVKVLDEVNLGKVSNAEFWIYSNEGTKPHFHIISEGDNKDRRGSDRFESCVRLDANLYFPHGSKIDTLNHKGEKLLYAALQRPYEKGSKKTIYEKLCEVWNESSEPQYRIKDFSKMPDYRRIYFEKEKKKKNS